MLMISRQLTQIDQESIKDIYNGLIAMTEQDITTLHKHLTKAIQIAESYGSDTTKNVLLNNLMSIKAKHFRKASCSVGKSDFEPAMKDIANTFKWALVWHIS